MAKNESWKELFKRAVALGFATAYMHTHQLERAPSLRVAYLAYRFLNGEDVATINRDGDHANQVRGTKNHQHNLRVPSVTHLFGRK